MIYSKNHLNTALTIKHYLLLSVNPLHEEILILISPIPHFLPIPRHNPIVHYFVQLIHSALAVPSQSFDEPSKHPPRPTNLHYTTFLLEKIVFSLSNFRPFSEKSKNCFEKKSCLAIKRFGKILDSMVYCLFEKQTMEGHFVSIVLFGNRIGGYLNQSLIFNNAQ